MAESLIFVNLIFLIYDFFIVFIFCKEFISKIVNGLHCFDLEAIKEFVIDKYYIFHGDNSFPSLFIRLIYLYIYKAVYLIPILYFLQKV